MNITIIGGGNMGGATARGLAQGAVAPENLTVSDPSQATLDSIHQFCEKIRTTSDNAAAAKEADIVIVAVKPWLVEPVLEGILPVLDLKRQLLVLIAAEYDQTLQKLHPQRQLSPLPHHPQYSHRHPRKPDSDEC